MPYPKFKKTEITKDEYLASMSFKMYPISTVSDPHGTLPMSTPGEYRMETVWGTDCEVPTLEVNTRGEETSYFKYTTK